MSYDLMVIGGGPAGYVAAERAGQGGLKVLLVEREELGGVCLNWGCIPTKTLLACAKAFYQAQHGAAFGVEVERAVFRLEQAQARKASVQTKLRAGIAGLMKKCKVEVVKGEAALEAPGRIRVGDRSFDGKNILIATGSRPAKPPIPGASLPHVVDSTAMLGIAKLPGRFVVIGGGVIGLEFASFISLLGKPVTVIELLPEIGGPIDAELAKGLREELQAKGVTFQLGAKVTGIGADAVQYTAADGKPGSAPADLVLMAVGRVANVEGLGLDKAGVVYDRKGIQVDDQGRTNVPGIWAAGDVTGRIQLAHVASRQGEVVVNRLLGREDRMRWHAVPGVIYTSPEVAFCGQTEAQAAAAGTPVSVAKWPYAANGRFLAEAEGKGLAKVVVRKDTRQVIGVHLLGHAAGEMIHSAAALIELEARVDEVKELIFPHPTVSESMRDALFHI